MLRKRLTLDFKQQRIMDEAFVSFMNFCPFFAYYFYDQMEVYYTEEVKTCATDGRRVYVNPTYMSTLKPMERCFALAHEVYHTIYKHPQRMGYYRKEGTICGGLPFVPELFNVAADYVINADLVDSAIGTCNSEWLYDPKIKATELAEDVYKKLWNQLPPPPPPPPEGEEEGDQPGGGGGEEGEKPPTNGSDRLPPPKTKGLQGRVGGDKVAAQDDGRMDEILEPHTDNVTGKEDLPSEMEFREAVTRAEAAAKRAGKLPGNLQRVIEEIREPTVSWKDEIRLKITGKIGNRKENWDSPNRRRIVLNPMIYMPSRQGNGADTVVVVDDTSGSISEAERVAYLSETAGIMNECRPKRIIMIWADAKVQRVEEARSLDEVLHHREAPGGGGTNFEPAFDYLKENKITPDALVYFTDGYPNDSWPDQPDYPVLWGITTDVKAPWGETITVKVS